MFKPTLCLPLLLLSILVFPARALDSEIGFLGGYSGADNFDSDDEMISVNTDEGPAYALVWNIFDSTNRRGARLQYEVYLGRAETDLELQGETATQTSVALDSNYLHFGGTYEWQKEALRPYIVATIGATHFDPDGASSKTDPSFGIGGGLKFLFSDLAGLRLDARGFGTVTDSDSAIFCDNGQCLVRVSGDVWWQYQLTAGLFLRF